MNFCFTGIYYKIRNRADEPGGNADGSTKQNLNVKTIAFHNFPETNY
jgi:hypothetical protein